MDNAGKVNDIGIHKRKIKTDQSAILGAAACLGIRSKIGNTAWAEGADIYDVHLAADKGLLPDEGSGRGHRRRKGAEGVSLEGSSNCQDEPSPEGTWVDIEKIESWVRNTTVMLPRQSKSISHHKGQTRRRAFRAHWQRGTVGVLQHC